MPVDSIVIILTLHYCNMSNALETPGNKKLVLSKSWQKYLLEFFVIAIAVFMGSLAENFREVQAEKRLTAELAQQFYDELLADSVEVQYNIEARLHMDTALHALVNYVRDSSLSNIGPSFIKNLYGGVLYSHRFQPTDVILQQLKSSGTLHHFNSRELQELTRNIGSVIDQVNARTAVELEFGQNYVIPFNIRHLDQECIVRLGFGALSLEEIYAKIDSEKVVFQINNLEGFKRTDVINMILVYRNLVVSGASRYRAYKRLNEKLLAQLRKEYHIEAPSK